MRIHHLTVKNFRGIRELDWTLQGRTICLIGSNDSTKTTILEAINYALSPRWNLTFSDSDFYQSDTEHPIEITLTVGEFPDSLKAIQKFGTLLRGWNKENVILDEPDENSKEVLTVRLSVDKTLEPQWHVIRNTEEKYISATDREKLGISRVGSYVDRDLSWGRGSTLTRVTESVDRIIFADINRKARQALESTDIQELSDASKRVEDLAKPYGVKPNDKFTPAFDADSMSINTGALSLHDGSVPIRQRGLGSKRLVTLAMQKDITTNGAIVLIDEIEHGLEPYRLRQLIRLLRVSDDNGQVIMITHSPIAVVELVADEINVVRNQNGVTQVTKLQNTDGMQSLVRSVPEAFLSPRIIVCEGKTEVGILRAFDEFWSNKNNNDGLAYNGVLVVNGDGRTVAPNRAIELKKLGYEVLLLVDSDAPIEPARDVVESHNISVVEWQDNTNTEQRVFLDMPVRSVIDMVALAKSFQDDEANFLHNLGSQLHITGFTLEILEELLTDEEAQESCRRTIGSFASSKQAWFKRTDLGQEMGKIIARDIESVPKTDIFEGMARIQNWIRTP